MTFAQRRNRLTTHFSVRIPVAKRRKTENWGTSSSILDTTKIDTSVIVAQLEDYSASSSAHIIASICTGAQASRILTFLRRSLDVSLAECIAFVGG